MSLVTEGMGFGNIVTEGFGDTVVITIEPIPLSQGGWIDVDRPRPPQRVKIKVEFPLRIVGDLKVKQHSELIIKSTLTAHIEGIISIKGTLFQKLKAFLGFKGTLLAKLTQEIQIRGAKDYKKILTLIGSVLSEIEEEEEDE